MFVQISVNDENGVEVANARNRMNVFVEGEARLLGLDNGDSTDYEQYKCNSRKLFSGKLIAIIGSTKNAGPVTIKVTSPGLPDAAYAFNTTPAAAREGSCDGVSGINCKQDKQDVPVRQIKLSCEGSRELNENNREFTLTATLLPANATYKEVSFRTLTREGIPSTAVKIDVEGLVAKITAVEDGECRIVCTINNGTERPEIMSDYELSVTGLGKSSFNPYELIYGCKFTECDNENSVSFNGSINLPKAGTTVRFDNVDFGEYGSDEIMVSLFTFFTGEPVEIWDGEPDKSECLFNGTYDIPSIYNVLQEDTFKLSKRLKGLRSITFRFPRNLTFGGFHMTKMEKAYGDLSSTEYSMITGDSYDLREDGVYAIGNNVDLQFNHMNFTEGVKTVTIIGRSHIPENPVHVRFLREGEEVKQICGFTQSEEIKEMTFPVESVTGEWNVDFIFMPGSNFDFIGFRFDK